MGYGTGAIMAVPGHDERDWEFARKFGLPIRQVVVPTAKDVAKAQRYVTELEEMGTGGMITGWTFDEAGEITGCSVHDKVFAEHGMAINSKYLDGLPTADAKTKIIASLEENTNGERRINYKLRDWLFSRQRYWGEPFPILWQDGQHRSLPESELPLLPPELDDYKPTGTGEPPLAKATDWVRYSEAATRETNTMPQWAGSCWYYLRFCDPRNGERFVGTEAEEYWMAGIQPSEVADRTVRRVTHRLDGKPLPQGGVDLYVGGTEHAVLHLLYARFWHKVLFDYGYVSTPEPFQRLVNQGMILGEMQYTAFRRDSGEYVSVKDVVDLNEEATDSGKRIVGHTKATAEFPRRQGDRPQRRRGCGEQGPGGFPTDRAAGHLRRRAQLQDVQEPGQRHQSGRGRRRVRRGRPAPVRDVHGAAGTNQTLEHGGRAGRGALPGAGVALGHGGKPGGSVGPQRCRAGNRNDLSPAAGHSRHHQESHGGHRHAQLQHGHLADDGLHQRTHRRDCPPGGGAPRALAGTQPLCAAPHRGTQRNAGHPVPRRGDRSCWQAAPGPNTARRSSSRTRSKSPSRSTASCANASSSKKTPLPPRSSPSPWPTSRSRSTSPEKTPRKVVVVPGKLVNVVA